MRRKRTRRITESEFRRFKETCQQAKAAERERDAAPVIYRDALLRVLLVVEHAGQLWLVPRRPGGWSARSAVTMTDAARSERLTVARDVAADWLGILAENSPQDAPGRTQTGNHDQRIGPRPGVSNERIRDVLPTGGTVRELANVPHGGRESESDS